MSGETAVVLFSGLLVACAPVPPPGASQPAGAPLVAIPPATTASAPEPPSGPQIVAIRSLSCARLLSAAQDDRAAGSMFYLGYAAARLGKRTIDVNEVGGMETAALDYCVDHPDRPAADAFRQAFGSGSK
jgi:hypothetical protein